MYRQINNFIKFIYIIWVWWLGVFVVQWWYIWDFLAEVNAKLTDENYISNIWWKAIVSDLYYKSLNVSRTNEVSAMDNAINMSLSHMKKEKASCELTKSDMLNILYFSNNSFKRSFKQNISNHYTIKPEYPNDADYLKSCHVFMSCLYDIYDYKDSPYITKTCSNKANELYLNMYTNFNSINTFDQINLGDDLFWNGKIDDADYDLLYDINIVGKILFEVVKDPPEVLYYQMPTVDSLPNYQVYTPYNLEIDWYSPYNPWDFESGTSWATSWTNTNWWSVIDPEYILNDDTNIVFDEWIFDEELENFLWKTASSSYSKNLEDQSNFLNWNICVIENQPESSQQEISTWLEVQEYLEQILEEISINTQWATTSITTWNYSFVGWESVELTWDKNEVLQDIYEQVESLANIDEPDSQKAIQSCIDKCAGLSIADKAICIVKCTCTEFASPAFAHTSYGDIVKAWAFKVKFCMVPVQNRGFSKNGKTAYSIEEIYNEILSILVGLRNSGELLVSKKTKEFLESSTTKNKFSKIFSFSISSSLKSLFDNEPLEIQKRTEEIFVDNLQKSVLCYWDSLDSAGESNKYISMTDPAKEIAKDEIIDQNALAFAICQYTNPVAELQADRLINFSYLIHNFLRIHVSFWEDVIVLMQNFNQTSQVLSKKG